MKKIDAIVALGGGISPEGNLSTSSISRIDMAVDLYKQGISDHIIATGRWWHRLQLAPPITEAVAMKQRAIQKGIANVAISTEEQSQDTIGNAFFIKRDFLLPQSWNSIAIVTNPAHVTRCKVIFEHVLGDDYEVVLYPTLEFSTESFRSRELLGVTALSRELALIPAGNDDRLASHFDYLLLNKAIAS